MKFTPEAPGFLEENYMRNDKEWFRAHKDIYDREIAQPFAELAVFLAPVMRDIDPEISCTPRRVSRIYRDVRLVRDGRIFKRSVWISLRRPKESRFDTKPEFYFWISPENFGWGCGYYRTEPAVMNKIREMILAGDPVAVKAIETAKKMKGFVLDGEMYKKDRFPGAPEELKPWLNRRHPSVTFYSDDPELFFSEGLEKRVSRDFKKLASLYDMFIKAELLAAEGGA